MQQEEIRYVLVWSGWLRLSHWLIALGVLFQISSAWAISHTQPDDAFWQDWHIIIGQVVLIALGLRAILLFFPGSSHWRTFIPDRSRLRAILQMLKFYLSLTRFPLPNWYAHNPLWQPLYLIFLLVLLVCTISGLLMATPYRLFAYSASEWHSGCAHVILLFSVLHVGSVFLHDWKGKGAFISAMINGYRYFHVASQSVAQAIKFNKK